MEQNNNRPDHEQDSGLGIIEKVEDELQEPHMYKVLIHNDDYTPMDFVVHVLVEFFHLSLPESQKVMMDVHNKGIGVAGIYSFEVAETKVAQVNQYAKNNKYPLKCSYEEES